LIRKGRTSKQGVISNLYLNQDDNGKASGNTDDNGHIIEFSISGNAKNIGIIRIAREYNTIITEIRVPESEESNSIIIRRAINFKSWNAFVNDIKTSIFSNLKGEAEKKTLQKIIANVETILSKNYEQIIILGSSREQQKQPDGKAHKQRKRQDKSDNIDDSNCNNDSPTIPFLYINQLVKKQSGTFNTKGTVVSIMPIMKAIPKIEWKCPNEYANGDEDPDYHDLYNEKIPQPFQKENFRGCLII
jgi:hypothetical protein